MECVIWTGSVNYGRPMYYRNRRQVFPQRETLAGKLGRALTRNEYSVLTCKNPLCVSGDHIALTGSPEHFWSLVDMDDDPNKCGLWTGAVATHGYGYFHPDIPGRPPGRKPRVMAHRVAWTLTFGSEPGELTVDHLCRVKLCQNARHMELVTLGENARRAQAYRASH